MLVKFILLLLHRYFKKMHAVFYLHNRFMYTPFYCFHRRPRIMHAVHIARDHELEIRFSLRVHSEFAHPLLYLFFESLNPGMKIYIGDYMLFDYRANGIRNKVKIFTHYTSKSARSYLWDRNLLEADGITPQQSGHHKLRFCFLFNASAAVAAAVCVVHKSGYVLSE